MNELFFKNLHKYVMKPARYVGNEYNLPDFNKDNILAKWVLIYPDFYEVGMSNTGLRILYEVLNSHKNIICERTFCVDFDMESYLKSNNRKLYSLESYTEIDKFDIIGITLQAEAVYTNIFQIFELANIPHLAKDRNENHPLIIGGGPTLYNPEPIADLFDVLLIGDGEEAIIEISECYIKNKHKPKNEMLLEMSKIAGVYIPSFFDFEYDGNKVKKIIPKYENYKKINKRMVKDIETAQFYKKPLICNLQLVHDRIGVEIQRGCTRGCRFCQAGTTYRPLRQRSPKKIKEYFDEYIKTTGIEEVGLLSLSAGDYDCIEPLMIEVLKESAKEGVSVSLPSLRVETITTQMIEQMSKLRKSGFTLAPEAGTERMRNLINKGNKESDLLESVEKIFKGGWEHLKFYFMIGFPTEEPEDITGIIKLCKECYKIGKKYWKNPEIDVSINVFIPKPQTPFQWSPLITKDYYLESRGLIYKFKDKSAGIKVAYYREALFESVISRSDRRFLNVLYDLYKGGFYLEQHRELIDIENLSVTLERLGFDMNYLTGSREKDELFPYDHIFCGITKQYLWNEYQNALNGVSTPDCLTQNCNLCGVCDETYKNISYSKEKEYSEVDLNKLYTEISTNKSIYQKNHKYLLTFKRTFPATNISNLDGHIVFTRIFRRSNIPLTYSQGFNQRGLISFYCGLAVGLEANEEYCEFYTFGSLNETEILNTLNKTSIKGIEFLKIEKIENKQASSNYTWIKSVYDFKFNSNKDEIVKEFIANKENYSIERETKTGKMKTYKVADFIESIEAKDNSVLMTVLVIEQATLRVSEILESIFKLNMTDSDFIEAIKKRTILK